MLSDQQRVLGAELAFNHLRADAGHDVDVLYPSVDDGSKDAAKVGGTLSRGSTTIQPPSHESAPASTSLSNHINLSGTIDDFDLLLDPSYGGSMPLLPQSSNTLQGDTTQPDGFFLPDTSSSGQLASFGLTTNSVTSPGDNLASSQFEVHQEELPLRTGRHIKSHEEMMARTTAPWGDVETPIDNVSGNPAPLVMGSNFSLAFEPFNMRPDHGEPGKPSGSKPPVHVAPSIYSEPCPNKLMHGSGPEQQSMFGLPCISCTVRARSSNLAQSAAFQDACIESVFDISSSTSILKISNRVKTTNTKEGALSTTTIESALRPSNPEVTFIVDPRPSPFVPSSAKHNHDNVPSIPSGSISVLPSVEHRKRPHADDEEASETPIVPQSASSGKIFRFKAHKDTADIACRYPGCGQLFTDPSTHRRHEEQHEENKLWICSGCGKELSRRDALTRHAENKGEGSVCFEAVKAQVGWIPKKKKDEKRKGRPNKRRRV